MADSDLFGLLTGRQLVKALAQLGLGERTPEAVRQWRREDPPCPMAEAGEMGMGHRYRLMDVLAWLERRAAASEQGKGFTRPDGKRTIELVQAAIAQAQAIFRSDSSSLPEAGGGAPAVTHAAPPEAEPATAAPAPPALEFSPAKNPMPDPLASGGRDPRSALAEQQARLTRIKADEKAGLLVPVADLDRSLQAQAESFRAAAEAARMQIKTQLQELPRDDQRAAMVDGEFDAMLESLASAQDLPPDPTIPASEA